MRWLEGRPNWIGVLAFALGTAVICVVAAVVSAKLTLWIANLAI